MGLNKKQVLIGALCATVTLTTVFQARAIAPLIPVAITALRLGTSMARNEAMISAAFALARTLSPSARVAAEKIVSNVMVRGLATGQVAFWANRTVAAPAPSPSNFGGLLNNYSGAGSSYFSAVNNGSGIYNSSSQTSLFGSQSNYMNSSSNTGSAVQNAWNQGASQARLGNSGSSGSFGSSFGSSSGGSSGEGQGSDCVRGNANTSCK